MKFHLFTVLLCFYQVQLMTAQTAVCSHRKPLSNYRTMQVNDFDAVHFGVHIEDIDFAGQQLAGHTDITIKATSVPVTNVQLDLLDFTVDSVLSGAITNTWSYNDSILNVNLNPALAVGDSLVISVYYHGTPSQDASGWGGFYFSGSYAFNLGVGFDADPHNYGRAWYPCFDNFTSRSRYDFYITTDAGSKAFCNGNLEQEINNPNGTVTWHWKMNQTIPSYLVSMAVAPYYTLERTSNGIPVEWATLISDTNLVLNTFSNLDTTLSSFITAYGDYPFDKVGYCLIPFNSGAMEHASSIHIGRAFINGSQTYATLWAHELSHMWWGDKVTCATAGDMWLNEGFATYNEAFYTEKVLGASAYRDWIRSNHRRVLQFAHTPAQDGSYLTMNNIPHANTYGFHVYQKGADLVHTMRNYMGDSSFFAGTRHYMNTNAYHHATSADLRDALTAGSGTNMNTFFDDWIFTPGFPHFSIDSAIVVPGGLDHVFLYTRQRSKGNNHIYNMKVEVNFSNGIIDSTVTIVIDSVTNSYHIPLYFMPTWISLDRFEKVSDAISSNEKTITATGSQIIPETNVTLNVIDAGTPSTTVRVEHHFVSPDPFKQSNPGIRLSDYHYWSVDGIFNPGFYSKAIFLYDGSTSATTGYLDNTLITGTEDSLVLLYRTGAGGDWQFINGVTRNSGPSLTDKKGSFTVDTLVRGEYALGYYDYTVGIAEPSGVNEVVLIAQPNPSSGTVELVLESKTFSAGSIVIYDENGKEIKSNLHFKRGDKWVLQLQEFGSGVYHAIVFEKGKRTAMTPIVIQK